MFEFLNKLVEGKNASVMLVLAASIYAGKLQIDQLKIEIAELKTEQKEVTRFLADHATTWAKIAERVSIYHKESIKEK